MGVDTKELINDYLELNKKFTEKKTRLQRLLESRDAIDKDRFESLKTEIEDALTRIEPKMKELGRSIKNRKDELMPEFEKYKGKVEELRHLIEQEKTLYKAEAIPKDQYLAKKKILEHQLKEIEPRHKELQSLIHSLELTLDPSLTTHPGTSKPWGSFKGGVDRILKLRKRSEPRDFFEDRETPKGDPEPPQKPSPRDPKNAGPRDDNPEPPKKPSPRDPKNPGARDDNPEPPKKPPEDNFNNRGLPGDREQPTFWSDFGRGLLIVLAIIIGLPLLGLFLFAAKGAALVLVPLLAFVVIIALLGRITRFVRSHWL